MYPGGIDPIQEMDHVQAEEIQQRRMGSSWKTWAIVMLVIAAIALLFVVFGEPQSSTDTTLAPPVMSS